MKKSTKLRLFVGSAFILGGVYLALRPHSHDEHGNELAHAHAHAHGEAAALSLNNGQRWETDAPLRTGMQRIRDAAQPVLAAHTRGAVTPEQAKAFAASVQEHTNYLIENCRLEPKADAALHVFITQLLTGAAHLAEDPASGEGATLITETLRSYPEYFNHAGWTPVS